MVSLAQLVASVAQVALQDGNHSLIQDIERNSETLDRISNNFSRILDKRVLKVWSFEEELAVTGGGKVCVICLSYDSSSSLIVIHRLCVVILQSSEIPVKFVDLFMPITLAW
jgi:hypothetical protein